MDHERALEKINRWHRIMAYWCMIFAVITFILWVGVRGPMYTCHVRATARLWTSGALTIFFGVLSATVKKIHTCLVEIGSAK